MRRPEDTPTPAPNTGIFDPENPPEPVPHSRGVVYAVRDRHGNIWYSRHALSHYVVLDDNGLSQADIVEGGYIHQDGRYAADPNQQFTKKGTAELY